MYIYIYTYIYIYIYITASVNSYHQNQPPKVFCKKGVLRNFAKFTGKHLCQSLFFNKVAGMRLLLHAKKLRKMEDIRFIK